ncbi:putative DNA-repair protein [Acinetobacter phage Scipio]|nr:putative DNA-repair protein [Acinetobacter phage Scipio]
MDKFEEYFRTTNHYENMLLEIARNQLSVSVFDKNGRKYRNHIVQTAYEVFQHQQAKVEELQERVDALGKAEFKLAQIKAILQNNPKLLESILVKKIEQALKGEG